jgi:hypothetical protein
MEGNDEGIIKNDEVKDGGERVEKIWNSGNQEQSQEKGLRILSCFPEFHIHFWANFRRSAGPW